MAGAEFEVPVRESSEAVAAILVAFDVFVGGREGRHEDREGQKFEVAVTEDLFGEEVQGRQHGADFAAGARTPLIAGPTGTTDHPWRIALPLF